MNAGKTTSPIYTILPALILLSALFAGCATIFNGTRQEISVTSEPPGASVFVNNVSFGQTPTVIDLKCDQRYSILLELHGFKPYELTFDRKLNTLLFVNVPVVGWVVDALSGAMYKLTPGEVRAMLVSSGPVTPVQPTMPALPPDSTAAVAPADSATLTPLRTVPAPDQPDSTDAEDEDEAANEGAEGDDVEDEAPADSSDGTSEIKLEDGRLYVFVVMEADPHWEKVGQLERLTE